MKYCFKVGLYKQGLLHKEIAKILDYGTSTVTNHLIKMGYTTYTINKDDVVRLYNEGYTDLEISQMLNCTRPNVTHCLNRLGIKDRKSKKDNLELRNKISNSLTGRFVGADNPNFKGYKNEKQIARGIFKTISKRKIRECNYTCQHCGKHGGNLVTHHIKPFAIILDEFIKTTYSGNLDNFYHEITQYKDFMDESNMIVLCEECHKAVHYSDNHELSPYRWESATTIEITT